MAFAVSTRYMNNNAPFATQFLQDDESSQRPEICCGQGAVLNTRTGVSSNSERVRLVRSDQTPESPPAVIIVGPPWQRSGTARVIQNQIEFYRSRGYFTLFVAVAIDRDYMRSNAIIWDAFEEGVQDLGADHVSIAALERKQYVRAKYTASIRHALRGTVLDWIVAIGRSAQLPDDVARFIRGLPVALIHVNHVYTMGFALRLRKQLVRGGERVPIIIETHDVQSHLLQQRGDLNPWTHRTDRLKRLIRSEKRLLDKADVLVHLSVDDSDFFRMQMPSKPQILTMPTIDESFMSTVNAIRSPSAEQIDLLFVGQSNGPNLLALEWFFEQVWPLISERRYILKIVGRVEMLVRHRLPQIYEAFRSCFVGLVADLAPYYCSSRCVIAPMVSGSGISIKTIEALALGKAFVGTSKAFRGMPMEQIKQAGLQAYDNPQDFADAITHTLCTERLAGACSRAAYDRVFSVQAAFASREQAVRIATEARNHRYSRRIGLALFGGNVRGL